MTTKLPAFMALKAAKCDNKNLRFINEDGKLHGYLQFSGKEVVSPYAKYEVEIAKAKIGLVHIRCCYNNKYWVSQSVNGSNWIVAGANKPEEHESKPSCTLFQPIFLGGSIVQFRHFRLGKYACIYGSDPLYSSCLILGSVADDFTFIDWESIFILPKHIAFKGDNGKYLSARLIENKPHLQFISSAITDPREGNEVQFVRGDGSVRIKSHHFEKFWNRSGSNWILADSDGSTSDSWFSPIKVLRHIVALNNLANKNFCKRHTDGGITDCLNAAVVNMLTEANLVVEEVVNSREIYNVNFWLNDARIYGQSKVTLVSKDFDNTTPQPLVVKLSYKDTKRGSWNDSVSLKLVDNVSLKSGIAFIKDGNVIVLGVFNGLYKWGDTIITSEVESELTATVPPLTKMKVSIVATQGSCDVPFSYTHGDILSTNKKKITYDMEDGIYTDTNCFNFRVETQIIV